MTEETYDIQKLVQETGVPRRTIYFYVQQGILPPPEGAGLAAYYTREHLLRLQLIPVMRGQGLRLDDIRQRLALMNVEEMARLLAEAQSRPQPLPSPVIPAPAAPPVTTPPEFTPPGYTPPGTLPGWQGRAVIQYSLPGGVTVLAPAGQTPDGEARLRRLLQAAAEIYQSPGVFFSGNGKIRTDHDPEQEA